MLKRKFENHQSTRGHNEKTEKIQNFCKRPSNIFAKYKKVSVLKEGYIYLFSD